MSQNPLILPTTGTVSGLQMTQNINNALDTLNTLSSGASAPSGPEAGQFWHDSTNNILKLRSLDNTSWISLFNLNETAYQAVASLATTQPQGRLTLSSNLPVMTSDVTGASTLYYAPYIGQVLPIYNGSFFVPYIFSQLSLSLSSSSQLSGSVYDVFGFLNSGVVTIGFGPAWSSTTSRGTGAGTTQLTQKNGLWVNTTAITLNNGATSYSSIGANEATYLGSVYCTANGQTGIALKPSAATNGNNNVIGVYNAYNRIRVMAYCRDNTSSWTYGTATWRAANGSSSNRINFLDGLQQSPVTGAYGINVSSTVDTINTYTGLNINSTSTTPNIVTDAVSANGQTSSSQVFVSETFYPVLGYNYVQAVEYSSGASSVFQAVGNSQQTMALTVALDI